MPNSTSWRLRRAACATYLRSGSVRNKQTKRGSMCFCFCHEHPYLPKVPVAQYLHFLVSVAQLRRDAAFVPPEHAEGVAECCKTCHESDRYRLNGILRSCLKKFSKENRST